MNATVANNEMSRLMPAGLSYRSSMDDAVRMQADGRRDAGRGLGRKIADGIAWLLAVPARRAVLSEMSMLSDRELADIGIGRGELKRVFDPAFARDYTLRSGVCRGVMLND